MHFGDKRSDARKILGTEVPQDDATWEFIFKLRHYP